MALPYLPSDSPLVDKATSYAVEIWRKFFEQLMALVISINTAVNTFPGFSQGVLADQPVGLGLADKGRLYMLTDYGHEMLWDGAKWVFAPGDCGNNYFQQMAGAPVETTYWQECDGSATTRIVSGGITITTAAITVPDLKANPSYLKSAAAYTGVLVSATAPGISGSTDGGVTADGATTADVTADGATTPDTTGNADSLIHFPPGPDPVIDLPAYPHAHPIPALTVPGLAIPALTVPGLAVPALGVGTLAVDDTADPQHLAVRVFYRR